KSAEKSPSKRPAGRGPKSKPLSEYIAGGIVVFGLLFGIGLYLKVVWWQAVLGAAAVALLRMGFEYWRRERRV
ncbi:MAG: hypothetical protein ACKOC5_11995, partial [Chloroflexota bacterium]